MLLDRVKDALPKLPPSLRRLGEAILADYQSVALMTVSEMSEKVGVSTASVMRFAREMGFEGFSDFQREIRHPREKAVVTEHLLLTDVIFMIFVASTEEQLCC